MAHPSAEALPFVRRVAIVVVVVLVTGLLLSLVLYAVDVVLLAFAGILLAVLIDGLSGSLVEKRGLSRGWALAAVMVAMLGAIAGAVSIIGPAVAEQAGEMQASLTLGLDSLRSYLAGRPWAEPLLGALPGGDGPGRLIEGGLQRITGTLTTAFGVLSNVLIVAFVGVYLAVQPGLYIDNGVRLFPKSRRQRIHEVTHRLGHALRRWLLGQFVAMSIVGGLTTGGLYFLGMPLALTLGLIAFLFAFIPYLGPVLATVPAVLVAFMEGPQMVLWVLGLYLSVQFVESNFVTPLVQRTVVSLPPAVLIMAQILMGALTGILGIALASPLAITVIVLVQMLYVEDVLGDDVTVLGEDQNDGD